MRYPPTCQILLLILCPLPSIEKKELNLIEGHRARAEGMIFLGVFLLQRHHSNITFLPEIQGKIFRKGIERLRKSCMVIPQIVFALHGNKTP